MPWGRPLCGPALPALFADCLQLLEPSRRLLAAETIGEPECFVAEVLTDEHDVSLSSMRAHPACPGRRESSIDGDGRDKARRGPGRASPLSIGDGCRWSQEPDSMVMSLSTHVSSVRGAA